MEADREFRRRMARFEIAKTRRLLAAGQPQRAAVALRRARLWRARAAAGSSSQGAQP